MSDNRFKRRAPSRINAAALVRETSLADNAVAVLTAERPSLDALGWATAHQPRIRALLEDKGAVLLRDFASLEQSALAELVRLIAGDVIEYEYASTPRSRLGQGVYTSTEYPADQRIALHNEMSYARRWPRWLAFYCQSPAQSGGRTPLADSAAVFRAVPGPIRDRFRGRGVRYIRNFESGLDLAWNVAFGSDDPAAVESYCARAGISWEWRGDGRLRTWQDCAAIVTHPGTREELWFNQATLFHPDGLPAQMRERLRAMLGPENLSRDCTFADGSLIDEADLAAVRAAYDAETVSFAWRTADILLLDNMRMAHGREPFEGPRRVLVAMGGATGAGQ